MALPEHQEEIPKKSFWRQHWRLLGVVPLICLGLLAAGLVIYFGWPFFVEFAASAGIAIWVAPLVTVAIGAAGGALPWVMVLLIDQFLQAYPNAWQNLKSPFVANSTSHSVITTTSSSLGSAISNEFTTSLVEESPSISSFFQRSHAPSRIRSAPTSISYHLSSTGDSFAHSLPAPSPFVKEGEGNGHTNPIQNANDKPPPANEQYPRDSFSVPL